MKTLIRNCDWLIAWDGKQHVYARGADIVFENDEIIFVGSGFLGDVEEEIDGAGRLVMPGFVNAHSHPCHEPVFRGVREDHGVRNMYMTGLYERFRVFGAFYREDVELRLAAAEVGLCELLKSGVTSVCDICAPYDGWEDIYRKSGIRGFLAPGFTSARWKVENNHSLGFEWDEEGGKRGLENALRFIDALPDRSKLLSGVVSPMQIENCTDELLRDSFDAARDRGLPFTLHVAQGVLELHEMIRRHGRTSIQHAYDIGIMSPSSIFGHGIFIDSHSWLRWWTNEDLDLLAKTETTVAHCPTPFARYGHALESFGGYAKAGVRMAIGTDTAPHNMIEEIRTAAILSRVMGRDVEDSPTGLMFHAATVGGATALLRADLGRLAVGCRADLVSVDLRHPDMMPLRDPLRSLIFHAAERAVSDVWVGGCHIVREGRVLTLDHRDAAARLCQAQERILSNTTHNDYQGRHIDEIAPLSLSMASR